MSEPEINPLESAFQSFSAATLPYVRPPGAQQAQQTARIRRRNRTIVSTVAAVIILIPACVVAFLQLDRGSTPPPTTIPTPTATPSPTGTPTPTGTPSPTATPPAPVTTTPATDGPGVLANATITLDWSWITYEGYADKCQSGKTHFANGAVAGNGDTVVDRHIFRTVAGDVDADGTPELIADIWCAGPGESGEEQVVALKSVGGQYTSVGRIVTAQGSDQVRLITDLVSLSNGQVKVQVADTAPCCAIPKTMEVWQWRTYAWSGSAFAQIGGPTTFDADRSVADVELSVPTVAMSAAVNGFRTGTIKVVLHNKGPQAARAVTFFLFPIYEFQPPTGGDWARCNPGYSETNRAPICAVGDIDAGQTVTISLPIRVSTDQETQAQPGFGSGTGVIGSVQLRAGEYRYNTVDFKASLG